MKFCRGIARAFQIPPEDIYRLAGLLPPTVNVTAHRINNNLNERLAVAFGRLRVGDQELVVALAERLAGMVEARIIGEEGE